MISLDPPGFTGLTRLCTGFAGFTRLDLFRSTWFYGFTRLCTGFPGFTRLDFLRSTWFHWFHTPMYRFLMVLHALISLDPLGFTGFTRLCQFLLVLHALISLDPLGFTGLTRLRTVFARLTRTDFFRSTWFL